ncbi:hypothetical protein R1sor_025207 [Riccia sorocarpa]|uniref:Reverse transcriptase zinc-binding domain-containing protein n=1 Tax=Riccia sorocarpa TaxID=122646 RepID=A0ABD3GDM2_9MARC
MSLDRSEAWLHRTGCRVLAREEEETYMGCKIGEDISEEHHTRDITSKITRRLSHWANAFLSWTSKVILLKHILRSLPVYQFLGLGLENISYRKLEVPCRVFLWGTNPEGRAKTALVSWEKITKQPEKGGLGITSFKDVSETLKMRYVGRLLGGDKSDWANMARFILHHGMCNRVKGRDFRWWTIEEGMLMLPTIPAPKNSADVNGCWQNLRQKLREAALDITPQQQQEIDRFQTWIQVILIEGTALQDSTSWRWEGDTEPWSGWIQLTRFWSCKIRRFEEIEDFTSKWTPELNKLSWKKRWSLLWQRGGSIRSKLWVWRLLHRGFYTGERAEKMRMSTDPCQRCSSGESESVQHMFWDCARSRYLWRDLRSRFRQHQVNIHISSNFLDTIDAALVEKTKGGIMIHILAPLLQTIRRDRNESVYRQSQASTPLKIILEQAKLELEGGMKTTMSEEAWNIRLKGIATLTTILGENPREETSQEVPSENDVVNNDHQSNTQPASTQDQQDDSQDLARTLAHIQIEDSITTP